MLLPSLISSKSRVVEASSRRRLAGALQISVQRSGEPLHRDEIVKRVLKSRYVKETTILLNLQGKDQFQRVAKATYSLAE